MLAEGSSTLERGAVMVDIETTFTDYEWNETSRPILTIAENKLLATIHVGGMKSLVDVCRIELESKDPSDLLDQIEGYRDIFTAAADWLRANIARKDGGAGV